MEAILIKNINKHIVTGVTRSVYMRRKTVVQVYGKGKIKHERNNKKGDDNDKCGKCRRRR